MRHCGGPLEQLGGGQRRPGPGRGEVGQQGAVLPQEDHTARER